jgi:hypothetical protein
VPTFIPLAVAAAALAYGVALRPGLEQQAALDRLREQYPLEAMADRVPEPRRDLRSPTSDRTLGRLVEVEQEVERARTASSRSYQLERVHRHTVQAFVNSPGFGVARMLPLPTAVNPGPERGGPPAQPGSPPVWHYPDDIAPVADADRVVLGGLHRAGVLDFVNQAGWGYVADGRRAAGFLPHAFSRVPAAKSWRVRRVELVGLLAHPEPVVYVTEQLPAMVDVRSAPTRSLDGFEAAGLAAVQRGEDVHAARLGDEVRFVGAVRSARQCVGCHGGERGDLLGAFSYTLEPVGGR